jgi:hypothetical protein
MVMVDDLTSRRNEKNRMFCQCHFFHLLYLVIVFRITDFHGWSEAEAEETSIFHRKHVGGGSRVFSCHCFQGPRCFARASSHWAYKAGDHSKRVAKLQYVHAHFFCFMNLSVGQMFVDQANLRCCMSLNTTSCICCKTRSQTSAPVGLLSFRFKAFPGFDGR